jgi:hypothetical protein
LLLPVHPPGENHDQKVHRQRHAHAEFSPSSPTAGNSTGSSTFWTPRAAPCSPPCQLTVGLPLKEVPGQLLLRPYDEIVEATFNC